MWKSEYQSKILVVIILSAVLLYYFLLSDVKVLGTQLSTDEIRKPIPLIVHFIVGQIDQKTETHYFKHTTPFGIINYLTFLAARRNLRPKKFFVHFYEEPNTFWWNITKKDREINFSLIKTRLVENIFGHPVYHHSHRSDILRLEILLKYGCIYLDTDVLTFRSFNSLMNLSDVVMGYQNDKEGIIGSSVILSKKNTAFLRRIYDAYQSYDYTCWACHATAVPGKLAQMYPQEVVVLPMNAFFLPRWSEANRFFGSNDYNFTSNFASHLWNTQTNDYLSKLTPDIILNGNFTLARMLRKALGNDTFHILKSLLTDKS
ncbi:unnamed protein product [Adineta steineri]|uniref:Alpha 1,4-glycosyltransferase domain-containing protein n=1 Tax=Adineta steineri TaxID=433720 RepID=A0A815ADS9_9BILA|nr:unnamed protein product [Adineta steineri]